MAGSSNTLADALHDGRHTAVIDVKSGSTVSAANLKALVLSTAVSLRRSGIQPGQTVSPSATVDLRFSEQRAVLTLSPAGQLG